MTLADAIKRVLQAITERGDGDDDPHIVIMIEPAAPDEKLSVAAQINQVFGPFVTGREAEEWTNRMADIYGDTREWCIQSLDHPNVVNKLDPETN